MIHPRPTLLFSVACLAGQLAGQVPIEPVPSEWRLASPWPVGFPGGAAFTRLELGRIGDDPTPDALVLQTGAGASTAIYLPNPVQHDVVCVVAEGVADAALLRGGAAGGRDAIAALTPDGVAIYAAAPGSQSPALVTIDGGWGGAQRLWTGAAAGGTPWVFAADAAGTSILRASWDGQVLVGAAAFAVPAPPTQLLVMDWDGMGERELAVLIDDYVAILTWDGQPLGGMQFPAPPPQGARSLIAVSRGTGETPQQRDLLVAYGWFTGEFQALVVNAGVAGFVPLGDRAAVAIATADRDGDGLEEVLLAGANDSMVHLLPRVNQPLPFVPSPGKICHLVTGPLRPNGRVDLVAAGDLDGDGDSDLLALQTAGPFVHLFVDKHVDGRRLVDLRIDRLGIVEMTIGEVRHLSMPLTATLPAGWMSLAQAGESLDLVLDGWVQADGASVLQHNRRVHVRLPLGNDPSCTRVVQVTFQADDLSAGDWILQLHGRLVRTNGGADVRLPSLLLHFTPSCMQQLDRAVRLHIDTFGAATYSGPGDGDGNTTGGKSDNQNPGPPPIP